MGLSNEDRCVGFENMGVRCLFLALLLEGCELDDLLCLVGFRENLLVLDLLDILLLLDVRVVELEEHLLVVHGLHPNLAAVALIVQLLFVRR